MEKLVERNPKIIEPRVFYDERGFFESFNLKTSKRKLNIVLNLSKIIVQNQLKGFKRLHYQLPPLIKEN